MSTTIRTTATGTGTSMAPVVPTTGALTPLGLDEVGITEGFWADRQRVNGTATLAHVEHWLEREGWIRNFDLAAAGTLPEGRRGREFADSEVYKYLEAVAWEIGRRGGDDALESRFRSVVDRVAAAQESDGYLNTRFGRPGQGARWSDLEWGHELYCLGHLFQAAVARARTSPGADDGLLGIATRAADLICEVFGADGIQSVCGHAEVEVGLAELSRVTGESRYLDLASLFVERRGHGVLQDIEWGRAYFQDDLPIRDAEALRGHAVRANYLAAGATDIAVEHGDTGLLDALRGQWDRTIARRTYLTGGQGSHHQDEAFGEDFELPSDRAYSETCAGIASIMFSWRLLLEDRDVRYADHIERVLYNVVATSPSAAGTAFFYANTLHQRTPGESSPDDEVSPRASSSERAPWFDVSCCPPNVARTLASLAAFIATTDDHGVQIHQFASATIDTVVGGEHGGRFRAELVTEYPRTGVVSLRIVEAPTQALTVSLRVPSWADDARLVVQTASGSRDEHEVPTGYADVTRAFSAGDVVELSFSIRPRVTHPDPRVDAIRGTVAIERGPEVYCVESVDLSGGDESLARVEIDEHADIEEASDGRLTVVLRTRPVVDAAWPYADGFDAPGDADPFTASIAPYHSWAERGPSTMRVWIPTTRS
ncbi:beta-L-arabinofuranosidase domain-containing protein [uncultured Plantibacter sp.]|uniref:glycoside hydrolase family 127 protein n=1 Tax=uncultured Plantibacter sp. TaxID=293337 RepID=UPI0028D090C5|nr:beta-L-arabinofuranosidase domain-containing protein [uncultured Plantibacter sp.]